jgi:formylmethanofuran dehydrogenase subunit B
MGEPRDQSVIFKERSRPAMREQQRAWVGAFARFVDEVKINAADPRRELPEAVQRRLLRTPVVAIAPVRA